MNQDKTHLSEIKKKKIFLIIMIDNIILLCLKRGKNGLGCFDLLSARKYIFENHFKALLKSKRTIF